MKDKIIESVFYGSFAVLFVILFIAFLDVRVFAASETSSDIPYNVAEMQSYNEIMLERLPIALQQYRQGHNIDENVPLLVWTDDGFYNNGFYAYVIMREPYLNPNYNYPEGYNFESNYIRVSSQYQIERILIGSNYTLQGWNINMGTGANLCSTAQSVPTSEGYFLPRYPFFFNGEPLVDSTFNTEVIISRVAHIGPSGSATEPDLTGDNIGSDKPDIDDYIPTPSNPPSINNNSLEDLVESLFDLVLWHAGQIAGLVKGIGEFLADTITYSIQKVIDNIKNAMDNLYANFKSLFEPLLNGIANLVDNISQKFEYLTEPLDSSAVQSELENTSLYGVYSDYNTFFTTFDAVFNNTSEPQTLIIPIHLENISTLAEYGVGVQYLDLTQFAEIRTPLRTFCWVFVSFGTVFLVAHSLPDWLKGSSGSSSNSSGKD